MHTWFNAHGLINLAEGIRASICPKTTVSVWTVYGQFSLICTCILCVLCIFCRKNKQFLSITLSYIVTMCARRSISPTPMSPMGPMSPYYGPVSPTSCMSPLSPVRRVVVLPSSSVAPTTRALASAPLPILPSSARTPCFCNDFYTVLCSHPRVLVKFEWTKIPLHRPLHVIGNLGSLAGWFIRSWHVPGASPGWQLPQASLCRWELWAACHHLS